MPPLPHREYAFDGLVGPTHHHAGLSFGNLASVAHTGEPANPRASALEGAALTNVGRVYDLLGEPERARDHYRQALDLMRATGDRAGEAQTLNHLGLLELELGETRDALARFGQALETFRALENVRWQGTVLHNIGLVYQSLGEWPRALSSYDEALRLRAVKPLLRMLEISKN